MTRDEAIAAIRRLCPPGTLEALGRPSGGHSLPHAAVEVARVALQPDPRAEPLDDEPTKRERRPSSDQVAAVVQRPGSVSFAAVGKALEEGRQK